MKSFICYYSIALISIALFLHGFFPVHQNQNKNNIPAPTLLKDRVLNATELYRPQVDRMVLVVIDALRLDFVISEHMPFSVSSYKREGCLLTVKVESPTVTLPRIKSLTTGSVPQFADVIFNLAGTDKHGNSFLHNAKQANRSVIFHGDDTWVTLYSDTFQRFEGFSTYYVSDFYEVDSNITRNVRHELNNDDWDIMVLHYSGLDHIGHIHGPFSSLIDPKLHEMDDIINKVIVESKTWNKRTLIAITGDHGMKNSGGHGGATFEETHIPLVLVGVPCSNCLIAQSDIPTTLSALLGLQLPSSGTGYVSTNVLEGLAYDRLLYILRYNTLVLLNIHKDGCESLFNLATDFHYDYLQNGIKNNALKAAELYEQCMKRVSEHLICSSTKQDEYILMLSICILINCLSIIVYLLVTNRHGQLLEIIFLIINIILPFCLPDTYFLKEFLLFISVIYLLIKVIFTLKGLIQLFNSSTTNFLVILTSFYPLSLISSSFIEEEHQVWYFLYGTVLGVQCYNSIVERKTLNWLFLFMMLRILRTLNQTGDKWAHLPDLTDWLLLDNNFVYLQILHCMSLVLIWLLDRNRSNAATLILIYIFHMCDSTWSAFLGKMVWLCITLSVGYNIRRGDKWLVNVTQMWVSICALLLRPYNTILIPACIYSSQILCKFLPHNHISLILIHIWLGKVFFFSQGHSNSLASIEIAAGYVGLNEYNSFVAMGQVLCHTYAFPILTSLLILNSSSVNRETFWMINAIFQLVIAVITCIIIFVQRHHLFIWTVFAPKIVFESSHSAVLLLQMYIFYIVNYIQADFKNKANL